MAMYGGYHGYPPVPAAPPVEEDRAELWNLFHLPDGRPYWGHSVSARTTWEEPATVQAQRERAEEAERVRREREAFHRVAGEGEAGWELWRDGNGKTQWRHAQTGQASSGMPKAVRDAQRRREQEKLDAMTSQAQKPDGDEAAAAAAPPPPPPPPHQQQSAAGPSVVAAVATPPSPPPSPTPAAGKAEGAEEQVYESKAERVSVFKQMLKEKRVAPTARWAEVMKTLLSDGRYMALRAHKDKCEAFDEYCAAEAERVREEGRAEAAKRRAAFVAVLDASAAHLSYPVSYDRARDAMGDADGWRAAGTEEERRACFDEYMTAAARARDAARRVKRQRRYHAFRGLVAEAFGAASGEDEAASAAAAALPNAQLELRAERALAAADAAAAAAGGGAKEADEDAAGAAAASLVERWRAIPSGVRRDAHRELARFEAAAEEGRAAEKAWEERADRRRARAAARASLRARYETGAETLWAAGATVAGGDAEACREVREAALTAYAKEKRALKRAAVEAAPSTPAALDAAQLAGAAGVSAASAHAFVACCRVRAERRAAVAREKLGQLAVVAASLLARHSEGSARARLADETVFRELLVLDPAQERVEKVISEVCRRATHKFF